MENIMEDLRLRRVGENAFPVGAGDGVVGDYTAGLGPVVDTLLAYIGDGVVTDYYPRTDVVHGLDATLRAVEDMVVLDDNIVTFHCHDAMAYGATDGIVADVGLDGLVVCDGSVGGGDTFKDVIANGSTIGAVNVYSVSAYLESVKGSPGGNLHLAAVDDRLAGAVGAPNGVYVVLCTEQYNGFTDNDILIICSRCHIDGIASSSSVDGILYVRSFDYVIVLFRHVKDSLVRI